MIHSCLIIGLGQIGFEYDLHDENGILTHSKAFHLHSDFEIIGAVEHNPNKRMLFAKIYQKPTFASVKEALANLKPDLIIISVPTHLHIQILSEVLDLCTPKLVLCEKPLSFNLEESIEIVETCKRKGVELIVNYIRRSDPAVIEIKRMIESGKIKGPLKAHIWYSKGLFNNCSHFINLIQYWFGNFESGKIISQGRKLPSGDIEPDLYMKFEKGTAIFSSCWEESFSYYTVEILSQSGRLFYDKGGEDVYWSQAQINTKQKTASIKGEKITILNAMKVYQWNVVEQLALHLNGEKSNLCTGISALETLKVIYKTIYN